MAGVALVFAMGLIMTGLSESFSLEVDRTLDAIGAQAWAVSDQASGPFASFTPLLESAGGDAAPPTAIGVGLALQAVTLSLAAAALAAVLALVLAPMFPMHVEIPASGFMMLPVVTVVVGLMASLIALHKTATVEPALAFGG